MKLRPLAIAFAALLPLTALADPSFSFSGYGTVGVVHSDNREGDYLVDVFKPNGPGSTRSWSADVDSRLGAQVSAAFTPSLSAVVQVLAQQRYDNSYTPVVEWANVHYRVTPDASVRAGRMVLPVFMVTDSRRVGYSNPWVRPPVEVYSLVPVTSYDGADASYRFPAAGVVNTIQVSYGRADPKFPSTEVVQSGEARARRLAALAYTVEAGPLTFRANYGEARLTVEAFDPLFAGFRQFGPPGEAIAAAYELRDRRVKFVGFGASYDPGAWFATAEYAHFDTNSLLAERTAWYVSGGHRFGAFTPYATYARLKSSSPTSTPGLDPTGLPPQLAGAALALNAALNAQLAQIAEQGTFSVGVRWDFMRNAALKLQYDRVDLGSGSRGTFGHVQPGFEPGGRVGLFSAAVDFVF
jgi:hypothetical protein